VPQSRNPRPHLPPLKQLSFHQEASKSEQNDSAGINGVRGDPRAADSSVSEGNESSEDTDEDARDERPHNLIANFAGRETRQRPNEADVHNNNESDGKRLLKDKQKLVNKLSKIVDQPRQVAAYDDAREIAASDAIPQDTSRPIHDFNERIAEQQADVGQDAAHEEHDSGSSSEEIGHHTTTDQEPQVPLANGILQNAFDRMRPRRISPDVATITIGSKTTTSVLGSSIFKKRRTGDTSSVTATPDANDSAKTRFSSSMQAFAAPGTRLIPSMGTTKSKARPARTEASEASDDGGEDEDSQMQSSPEETALDADEQDQEPDSNDPDADDNEVDDNLQGASGEAESDADYIDEEEKKVREDAKVAELIRRAEKKTALPSQDNKKRAHQALKGSSTKDCTTDLLQVLDTTIGGITSRLQTLQSSVSSLSHSAHTNILNSLTLDISMPLTHQTTLTITKPDFARLHIIGQFNLGFILATRNNSDLFIIDQHASDEKINFERLQATTVMQSQRLVRPLPLELTAVDEEIILENQDALIRNGFEVSMDTSGETPVGQRCKLLTLPMSKGVTFSPSDLEELIALLADSPSSTTISPSTEKHLPRPSKIRKLFAMRACRSSVMIGKPLTQGQMGKLVGKLGEIDKPWNCPHGRPTLRHVCGLGGLGTWDEGREGAGDEQGEGVGDVDWASWAREAKAAEEEAQGVGEDEEEPVEGELEGEGEEGEEIADEGVNEEVGPEE